MKRTIFIIIFSFFYHLCFSQTSIKLSTISGRSVLFNFENSISEIKNGKQLGSANNGYTKFVINYKQDVDFSSLGWKLMVRANTSFLEPDYGSSPLSLDAIKLYTYIDGVYQSTITLSSIDQVIAINNISYPPTAALPQSQTNTVTIVYDCGKAGELWGLESDIYFSDLFFNVVSQ